MTTIQLTLAQIDNYGPWTVTPEPRREMDLQILQSQLFADMAQFLGSRDGYVFSTRFDNMVAVTNRTDADAHKTLQASIRNRYPVTISFGVGVATTPIDALKEATERVQAAGSAQDQSRCEVLAGEYLSESSPEDLAIAHFDVNGATEKYTDQLNGFDSFIRIEKGYASVMRYMREEYGALSFFVGGDNIISVCPNLDKVDYQATIDHVGKDADVDLKVGIGYGPTAHKAGYSAKYALERCRSEGTSIEFADGNEV